MSLADLRKAREQSKLLPQLNQQPSFAGSPAESTLPPPMAKEPGPPGLVAKMIQGGEEVLGFQSDILQRKVTLPIAIQLADEDPLAIARLELLQKSTNPLYLSDVTKAAGLMMPDESDTGLEKFGKATGNFALDVAGDPLTYETFLSPTKLGTTARQVSKAKLAKQPIALESDLAKRVAKLMGGDKPTAKLIENFPDPSGGSLAQQVKSGERSLMNFAGKPIPGIGTGKVAGALATPLSKMNQLGMVRKVDEAAKALFSTKTGNTNYDEMVSKYRDLVLDRIGVKVQGGREVNKMIEDLTRELGMPREKLMKQLRNTQEAIVPIDMARLSNTPTQNSSIINLTGMGSAMGQTLRESIWKAAQTGKHVLFGTDINKWPPAEKAARQVFLQGGTKVQAIKAAEATAKPSRHSTPTPTHYTPVIPTNPVEKEVQALANELAERDARQLMMEQTAGVKVRPLLADRQYAPHIMTPEAREIVKQWAIKNNKIQRGAKTKEFNTWLGNALHREFVSVKPEVIDDWVKEGLITQQKAKAIKGKDGAEHLDQLFENGNISEADYASSIHTLGIDEVNEIVRTKGLPLLGTKEVKLVGKKPVMEYNTIDEFFHTDPAYYSTVRGVRGEKARTAAEFYGELKQTGIAVPHAKAPDAYMPVPQPELAGYRFEPSVAKHLRGRYKMQHNPTEVSGFLKVYDKIQDTWKAHALAYFPEYHTRNAVGNIWNNWLAGVKNPQYYTMADGIRRGKVTFTDGVGKKWTSTEVDKTARELGVIDRGWYGSDIERELDKAIKKGKPWDLTKEGPLIQGGFKVGRYFENNARMAHFVAKLMEGETASSAAMSVKKYLFDYSDLTDTEKNVFKRLFPFYTWTRKNVPLQLQHLVTDPGKYGAIYKAQHEVEESFGGPQWRDKQLAQWMQESFATRVRYNKEDGMYEYFILNNWLPATDIVKLAKIHDVALNMLSPMPKELAQQIWNYDFFLKRRIVSKDDPGQKQKFLGGEYPVRFVHGAKIIRLLNEVDKLITNPDELSLFSKIIGSVTGKTYTVSPEKAAVKHKKLVDESMSELRKQLYRNAKNPKEVERIMGLMQEKAREY